MELELKQEGPGVPGISSSAGELFGPEEADVWFSGMTGQDGVPCALSQCEAVKCNSVKGWALELC